MRTLNIAEVEMVSAAGVLDNYGTFATICGGLLGGATAAYIAQPYAIYGGVMALVTLQGTELAAAMLITGTLFIGVTGIGTVVGAAIGYGLVKTSQTVADYMAG